MRKLSFLLVLSNCILGSYLIAQNDITLISNIELINSTDYTVTEVYEEFKDRYEKLMPTNDAEKEYELSRLLFIAGYRATATRELEYWMNKTDSLRNVLSDESYDRSFQFAKISWAYANKKTAFAIEMLKEMEPYALASKDTIWMIDYHIKSVRAYASFDEMALALKHLFDAEQLNEQYDGNHQRGLIFDAKSAIEWEKRNPEAALDYELKAEEIFEQEGSSQNLGVTIQNILALARKLGDKSLEEEYMKKQSEHRKKEGCMRCFFSDELNRTLYYIQSEKYQDAIDLADKMILYADSMNRDKSHAIYLKGVAYRGLDQYDKAERFILRAFDIAKELNHLGKSSFYSHALYQTYYWKDKFEPALEWYQIHTSYQDSVYNEKKAKEIAVYEAKLESLEQKRVVADLEAKVKIDQKKKQMLWLSILLGSGLGLVLLYAQRQRAKKKEAIHKSMLLESNLKTEKLQQLLEYKERELATQILNITQKNNLLHDLSEQIKMLKGDDNQHKVSRLLRSIKQSVENSDEWDQFLSTFKSIHSSFLSKLNEMTENLTSSEIRLASLMKMNLSSKEIATMLNISDEGVKKARYRLRKKLGISSDINIQDYLLAVN